VLLLKDSAVDEFGVDKRGNIDLATATFPLKPFEA